MKTFHNFTFYTPENNKLPGGILFLCTSSGLDWYEIQKDFEIDTIKIMYDVSGVIRSVEKNVSGMWPVGCSISEILEEDMPDSFELDGSWVFSEGAVVKYQPSQKELSSNALREKMRLMDIAATALIPLQNAADLNMATDKELKLLSEWKKYSVLLNRIDTALAPNILWPEQPV